MDDHELLLFTWAQMCALELVDPAEHAEEKHAIENQLNELFEIRNIQLVGKTLEEYAVGYIRKDENHLIRFESEDVESIYDL